MYHESQFWPRNCFVTLTYNPEHKPIDNSISKEAVQKFIRALRDRHPGHTIRFFAVGEYGDKNGHPHYHLILFNYEPDDLKPLFKTQAGNQVWTSAHLEDVWGKGFVTVGSVTIQSCGYTARYLMKKIKGTDRYQADRYRRVSPQDGKMYDVQPEFALMSLKPGIGHNFAMQFKNDFYPSGFVTIEGTKHAAPNFYLNKLTEDEKHTVKLNRMRHRVQPRSERTMERKVAREGVRNAKVKPLQRDL